MWPKYLKRIYRWVMRDRFEMNLLPAYLGANFMAETGGLLNTSQSLT